MPRWREKSRFFTILPLALQRFWRLSGSPSGPPDPDRPNERSVTRTLKFGLLPFDFRGFVLCL